MSGTFADPEGGAARSEGRAEGAVARLQAALAGPAFPAFMLTALALFQALMLGLLLLPTGGEGLGAFAEQFKVWCFRYDPATGTLEPAYVVMLIADPLLLGALVVGVWWRPLRTALRERPRGLLRPALAAAALASAAAAGLVALNPPPAQTGPLPFPGARIRTALTPPDFRLTNHLGEELALSDLRGRAVLVTAVYATCGDTCPMIMGQAKGAVAALSDDERSRLTVVGITLDPARDDVATLARMAEGQEIAAPLFNLCTGEPAAVEAVLDRFGVARRRDPETGVIDHANLFFAIDPQGRIAYRLTLGEGQEQWLTAALRELVHEARPGA